MLRFICIVFLFHFTSVNCQTNWKKKVENSQSRDSAIFYLQKWQEEALFKGNKDESFQSSVRLIRLFAESGFVYRANSVADSLKLLKNSVKQKINLFSEIGVLKRYMNQFDSAVFYYDKAFLLSEKNGVWQEAAENIINKAELFRATENYKEAQIVLNKATDLVREKSIRNPDIIYRLYGRKAAVFNESSLIDSSFFYCRKAIALGEDFGLSKRLIVSYTELASLYDRVNKKDSCEYFYKKAIQLAQHHNLVLEELQAFKGLGYIYGKDEYGFPREMAISAFEYIIQKQQETNVPFDLNVVYYWLSIHLERNGDFEHALKYRELAYKALREIEKKKYDTKYINITEEFNSEKLKSDLAITQLNLNNESRKVKVATRNIFVLLILIIFILVLLFLINKKRKRLDIELIKKQALIQEVHHRTKNNIQFMSSLINLQMNTDLTPKEILPLKDVSRRIQAMGLVHEMLYNENDVAGVDIDEYLAKMIKNQQNLINSDHQQISFELNTDTYLFDISTATSIGIIVSECISNSIEHAFNDSIDSPLISVELKKESGEFILRYFDNGIGLSPEYNIYESKSLGLKLVDIFVRQLKGKFFINRDSKNGFILNVKFKV